MGLLLSTHWVKRNHVGQTVHISNGKVKHEMHKIKVGGSFIDLWYFFDTTQNFNGCLCNEDI